jgi:putative restriction endonuclease
MQVPTFDGSTYAEGAHVRPLGRPHVGRDALENILCLCPNHHTQFDFGGLVLSDNLEAVETHNMTVISNLVFRKNHVVNMENVRYHRQLWTPVARSLTNELAAS